MACMRLWTVHRKGRGSVSNWKQRKRLEADQGDRTVEHPQNCCLNSVPDTIN